MHIYTHMHYIQHLALESVTLVWLATVPIGLKLSVIFLSFSIEILEQGLEIEESASSHKFLTSQFMTSVSFFTS
jgi:hypothetical protein